MRITSANFWRKLGIGLVVAGVTWLGSATLSPADIVHNDDVIIIGSLNVGFDSVVNRNFGFDTIILSENNLRILFEDTSNAPFPTNDWRIIINDSANGGVNFFGVQDVNTSRQVFKIEAGARSSALYVESDGDIGIGTSNPAVDVQVQTGNTPTYRLAQDGTSGFTPQTWDIAGNETNFFIRDVTNGSTLPFRIRPNAPTSSIDIEGTTGDVGMGTSSPNSPLHIRRTTGASADMLYLENNDNVRIVFEDTGSGGGEVWRIDAGTSFAINGAAMGGNEFVLTSAGNLTITGSLTTAMNTLPDYVFSPDYPLMPLAKLAVFIKENKHLPNVPSQAEVDKAGKLNMTQMQMRILEKVEELTLYTLEQEKTIQEQEKTIQEFKARLAALEPTRVAN